MLSSLGRWRPSRVGDRRARPAREACLVRLGRADHQGELLCANDTHAQQLLDAYRRHYNDHRPHQARGQLPPDSDRQPSTVRDLQTHRLRRTRILGGMINEYRYTA